MISKSINQKGNKSIFIQDRRDDAESNKIDLWWDTLNGSIWIVKLKPVHFNISLYGQESI